MMNANNQYFSPKNRISPEILKNHVGQKSAKQKQNKQEKHTKFEDLPCSKTKKPMSTKFKEKKRVLSSILEAKKGKWERHIETLDDGNETLAKFAKTVINIWREIIYAFLNNRNGEQITFPWRKQPSSWSSFPQTVHHTTNQAKKGTN